MSRRSAYLLLTDMLEAVSAIEEYIAGYTFDAFVRNRMLCDAVVRNVQVLGEAANRVPKDFRDQHQDIEWTRVIRTRHILVHDYFGIDYTIVWRIITVHLQPLRDTLQRIIQKEFPDGDPMGSL